MRIKDEIKLDKDTLNMVFMGAIKLRARDFSEDAAVRTSVSIYEKTYDELYRLAEKTTT